LVAEDSGGSGVFRGQLLAMSTKIEKSISNFVIERSRAQ
jgi:hypothetical protein